MTRGALVVGIDHYPKLGSLHGCVSDAHAVKALLEIHANRDKNFEVILLEGSGPDRQVTRAQLRDSVRKLFAAEGEVALFYFAGHGHVESSGGCLSTSDDATGDDGMALSEVMALANGGRAGSRIVILDSCFSGALGDHPFKQHISELAEGVTILTASTSKQEAMEAGGGGLFTALLLDALNGAAANLVGEVSPGSVYAHIDQSLGYWGQRPVFKTNVKYFVSLRRVEPPLPLPELRRICEFFPRAVFDFRLDPAYEPTEPSADPVKCAVFAILQKYNRVGLLVPVDAPHMYYAAIESKSARLTELGEHYRRLAAKKRI